MNKLSGCVIFAIYISLNLHNFLFQSTFFQIHIEKRPERILAGTRAEMRKQPEPTILNCKIWPGGPVQMYPDDDDGDEDDDNCDDRRLPHKVIIEVYEYFLSANRLE